MQSLIQVIIEMAETLEQGAKDLRRLADSMQKAPALEDALDRADEAVLIAQRTHANLKLNLITKRALRVMVRSMKRIA